MAFGLSDLRMNTGLAACVGQSCHCMSCAPIDCPSGISVLRHQHIDGVDRHDGGGGRGRRLIASSPGEQRGGAAGGDRNHENNQTRGFHTLTFHNDAVTQRGRHVDFTTEPSIHG